MSIHLVLIEGSSLQVRCPEGEARPCRALEYIETFAALKSEGLWRVDYQEREHLFIGRWSLLGTPEEIAASRLWPMRGDW